MPSIILSALATLITFGLYMAARKTLQDEHEYRRREFALKLIDSWDSATIKSRTCIMNKWYDQFLKKQPIEYDEIIEYRQVQIDDSIKNQRNIDEQITVIEHVQIILNYFESIALAIEYKVADDDMLKDSFLNTFDRWYEVLKNYRTDVKHKRGFDPWEPLTELHSKWFPHLYHKKTDKRYTGK